MGVPPRREIEAEERLLREPLYNDLRPKVVALVTRLQRAETVEDWVQLHRDLLIEFGGRQDAADEAIPAAKQKVAAEIAELARLEPKPTNELRARQEILDRIKMQDLVARASQHTLRQIGDGIAWRALRYDRRAISILGEGERVGRLASGVGLEAELIELGRLFEEEGVFAIHNDLTNCLRHGDLTAIRPSGEGLDVTLIEVKAGARPDNTPQMQRLERATELLQQGRRVTDGDLLQVTVIPSAYETYLDSLPQLIGTAREVGFSWARPHPAFLIGAVDYRVYGRDVDVYSKRSSAERRETGWEAGQPDTLDWTASLRRIRDRSWSFSSLAPFTIFPLSPEDVADLVMGFVDLAYSVHLAGLEAALTTDGRTVRVARQPESAGLFLEAGRSGVGVRVPPHLREQMMVELVNPACLQTALDHILALNAERPEEATSNRVVVFGEESSVWEPGDTSRRKET